MASNEAQSRVQGAIIDHTGEQTGVAAQILIKPKDKIVVVVMGNTSGTWKEVVMLASKLMGVAAEESSVK